MRGVYFINYRASYYCMLLSCIAECGELEHSSCSFSMLKIDDSSLLSNYNRIRTIKDKPLANDLAIFYS